VNKNGVICAIDVNDYDQNVVDLAASMAKQFGLGLDLIHVTLFPNPNNAASPAYLNAQSAVIGDHRRLKNIKTNVADVGIDYHHVSGFPSEQIIGFVDRNEPVLLVLGTHARQGLSRIFGSVAMKIMRNVDCPVMVLKQERNDQSFALVPNETLKA
jgi:nucleotide-binding universal stress UspA family protein